VSRAQQGSPPRTLHSQDHHACRARISWRLGVGEPCGSSDASVQRWTRGRLGGAPPSPARARVCVYVNGYTWLDYSPINGCFYMKGKKQHVALGLSAQVGTCARACTRICSHVYTPIHLYTRTLRSQKRQARKKAHAVACRAQDRKAHAALRKQQVGSAASRLCF